MIDALADNIDDQLNEILGEFFENMTEAAQDFDPARGVQAESDAYYDAREAIKEIM